MKKDMCCKNCGRSVVPVGEVGFDHSQGKQHARERRELMIKAHKCGYHIGCFEGSFDPFKQYLLVIKAEREENENRN